MHCCRYVVARLPLSIQHIMFDLSSYVYISNVFAVVRMIAWTLAAAIVECPFPSVCALVSPLRIAWLLGRTVLHAQWSRRQGAGHSLWDQGRAFGT